MRAALAARSEADQDLQRPAEVDLTVERLVVGHAEPHGSPRLEPSPRPSPTLPRQEARWGEGADVCVLVPALRPPLPSPPT